MKSITIFIEFFDKIDKIVNYMPLFLSTFCGPIVKNETYDNELLIIICICIRENKVIMRTIFSVLEINK